MRSRTVRWDGAEQVIEHHGSLGTKYMGLASTWNVRAASLFIHILDRDGASVHTKRRGLELMQHVEFSTKRTGGYSGRNESVMRIVDDVPPIEDKEMVRIGVAAALSPFLPEKVASPASTPTEADLLPKETEDADPS